ncbi:hypothetical protein ADL29_17875 [Streptomyces chattanoogensis]|uniref:Uncharacterized protein n=2 Tax=Streptomyces chattanoogensis TaxID=66876 RepID=A0A0N0XV34_9ACTN|nr:hypothetical protein ADL29_17875 [Streptomyces chattanoogensis]
MARALERDAGALLADYRAGMWTPSSQERGLAEDLARGHWSGSWFREGLRGAPVEVRVGRLADVLDPAASVLEEAGGFSGRAVLLLRQLLDAISPEP